MTPLIIASAKTLVPSETNVSYICSRYYRAPELLFNAVKYTCQIDIWSTGCIQSELMSGQPIFLGDSALNQLVEIVKILGTPSNEQILRMNPEYNQYTFPQICPRQWDRVFKTASPDAISLISKLLVYQPTERLTALDALGHSFFDELREPNLKMPNGAPLPELFNFTEGEIATKPDYFHRTLIPNYLAKKQSLTHGSSEEATNGLKENS
ncbi:hypothetical protein Ciccas_001823 [Cichlidogyrus casuarinus]|uniref:Protein kinase domain-containing protein n=1 Tax=Cichlidogyrus casuarinus TaxID=1844966 RepID=A0ABD2QM45_9PLAT